MQDILILKQQALNLVEQAQDLIALEAIRVDYLGKKGKLTEILKNLVNIVGADKPKIGLVLNQAKREISAYIEKKTQVLQSELLALKLASDRIDISLKGRGARTGSLHPVSQVKWWVNDYFSHLGFEIVTGSEIETEFYNFEALNIPAHHPARAMHDTFYFGDGSLLRTHTSPVQIHIMENNAPPLRLIAPGRVYRCDSDLTHTPMFHQVEGLLIEQDANLAGLKGLLSDFFMKFFGRELGLRFRPSYFPFTEPSAEVDIECTSCLGSGCRACSYSGWLEVLGCGMVHPRVLSAVNISAEKYQGWAFGMGLDRLAMLYYGIDDLRMMFENNLAFLSQF